MNLFPCKRCLVKACCKSRCELLEKTTNLMSEKVAPIAFFVMMIPFGLLIYFLIHYEIMIGIYALAAIWLPCGWLAKYISYKMDSNIEIDFKLFLVMLFGGALFLIWMLIFVVIPIKYNDGVDYYASEKGPM